MNVPSYIVMMNRRIDQTYSCCKGSIDLCVCVCIYEFTTYLFIIAAKEE